MSTPSTPSTISPFPHGGASLSLSCNESNLFLEEPLCNQRNSWLPAEPDLPTILNTHRDPLRALAQAEMPAIVFRQVYNPAHCPKLLQRFTDWGLMRDPKTTTADQRNRIDIGTSLGNRGHNKERFLDHAMATHDLFRFLFTGFDDPVHCMYNALQQLAGDKTVKVAQEPDGRQYGPAIFRIHYDSHAYKPHIDHVTLQQ
ncbi:MAG: hypothetical protein R2867_40765 [Caldilineaceae bacterium]